MHTMFVPAGERSATCRAAPSRHSPRPRRPAGSGLEGDQGVAAFGKTGPWLDLHDAVEHVTLQTLVDLAGGAAERAAAAGAGGGHGVAGKELQFVRAAGKGGEFDGE